MSDFPFTPLYISGKACHSSTNSTFEVRNPYTGQHVGTSSSASLEDCLAAVQAAQTAFPAWSQSPLAQRRDILNKAADLLDTKYKDEAVKALIEETATAKFYAQASAAGGVQAFRAMATWTAELKGETYPSSTVPGAQVVVQRRPYGVVFSIAPWNVPINLTIRAVAVPLLCGNTVVLKSSEYSPRAQEIIVQVLKEAGLPDGVLNYLSIRKEDVGEFTREIIASPLVKQVNVSDHILSNMQQQY